MKRAASIVVTVSVAAAGCATSPEWAGTIEERDGVVYVSNPADGLWAGAEAAPLRFELEQVFGSDGVPIEAMLGNQFQFSLAVGPEGNVYVFDGQASRLVAFSPEGKVLWTGGREGGGPGEFENVRGLALLGAETLVIANHSSTRLDVWSTAGEFVTSHSLAEPPLEVSGARFFRLVGALNGGELVGSSTMMGAMGSQVFLLRLDPPGVREPIEWNQLPDLQMPPNVASGVPVGVVGDRVALGSTAGYRFRLYDEAHRLHREVSRDVAYPVRSGFYQEGGSSGISGYGSVSPPMRLSTGHLLVAVSWVKGIDDPDAAALASMRAFREQSEPPPREYSASIDLYDAEGRFLYSIVEDGANELTIGSPRSIGPEDRLYTISGDPFPQVRRYRVIVDG